MGQVFLARDTMFERQVSRPNPHGEDVARFEREANVHGPVSSRASDPLRPAHSPLRHGEVRPGDEALHLPPAQSDTVMSSREIRGRALSHEEGVRRIEGPRAVSSSTMDLKTIGHYEVVRLLGEGGMGRVFLARDTMLDREVAVKVLSSPNPLSEEVLRFEREARALAALDHPNILSVHEFGRMGTMPYVVMELLDGRNLRQMLAAGPMSWRTVIGHALEIAHGLSAAHEKKIFHRDLKPENIFVTNGGRVKIVDFGLANMRQRDHQAGDAPSVKLTAPGWVVGTLGYMAPEQVRGELVDHRADLFALGSVLFEMLTGKPAFDAETTVASMHAVLEREPPLRLLVEGGVPRALIDIVSRCLEKSPAHRFQSAQALLNALEDVRAQSEWGGSAPGSYRPSSGIMAGSRRTSVAVIPFTNVSADPEMEYFSDGVTEDVINALTQIEGLYVAARTSCFAFKGKSAAVSEIGAALRVKTILEGSVRRAGKRLRITAQLIDVADGYHLWSERYDRELDDVFAIQDEIAVSIAQKLRIALADKPEDEPLYKPATRNLDAYEHYLKARFFVEQRGEGLYKGLEFFNQAIAADPDYALAYAGKAETLCLLAIYAVGDSTQILPAAKEAAEKALQLDEGLAEAHNAVALVSTLYDWNWERAIAEFDRALEIHPRFVASRFWKGMFCLLFVQGRTEEALREMKRAVELDPMATLPAYALGLAYMGAGQHEEAMRCAQRVLSRDPAQALMHRVLGLALSFLGRYEEATASLERGVALSMRHPFLVAELGVARASMGDLEGASRMQEELQARARTTYISPMALGAIPLALGDLEEGYRTFALAAERKEPNVIFTTRWPTYATLRKDPRVIALFETMGVRWIP